MKLHTALLAVVGLTVTIPAGATDPATSGALGVSANRIVGLWSGQGAVSPCGTNLPPSQVRNTIVFHAGGTVSENARFPPTGAPNVYGVPGINWRSAGLGKWSYDPATGRYAMHLRFDWFVDGVYHGYQTVERDILLSNDGLHTAGPVRSVRYATNGSTIIELCGTSVSDRL